MNIDFGTDTSRIPRDDPTHALFPIYATMTKSILTFPPNFQRNFYSFYVLSNSTRSKTSDTRVSDTLHRNSITISKHVHISSFYIFSRLISPSLSLRLRLQSLIPIRAWIMKITEQQDQSGQVSRHYVSAQRRLEQQTSGKKSPRRIGWPAMEHIAVQWNIYFVPRGNCILRPSSSTSVLGAPVIKRE